jgi:hypothetical protein
MINLPKKIIQVLRQFEGAFGERVWQWAKVLLTGKCFQTICQRYTAMADRLKGHTSAPTRHLWPSISDRLFEAFPCVCPIQA